MAETKTFKNPYVVESTMIEPHIMRYDVAGNRFTSDEWDMEVTFTRKAKPFKVGDLVYLTEDDPNSAVFRVLGVWGSWVWVTFNARTNSDAAGKPDIVRRNTEVRHVE